MDISSFFLSASTSEWVLILLFILFFAIQLLYYVYLFRKPYLYAKEQNMRDNAPAENKDKLPGVSIIITAKNEARNLEKNLPFILRQDYHKFQVVVVNNASTDNTRNVLKELQNNYPNLYITYIPIESESINNKKRALTIGIKAAKHEILLFTEPDTKPLSEKWVYEYAKTFKKGIDIVIGGCQVGINKSCFKKYILYDNLISGIKYLSMALIKKPYMGIGRNMAFRKNIFFENNGFSSVLNIEDGEDDVFINRAITKENTVAIVSQESMVVSNAVKGILSWRNIKSRYLTTKKNYTGKANKLLAFEVFSRYMFYLLFITLFVIGILSSFFFLLFFTVLLFLIRYLTQLIILNKNSEIYNSGKFYLLIPVLDLLTPISDFTFQKSNRNRE